MKMPPSLWADTAPAGPACPALVGTAQCEVAVVGAGFTGLSAALHLAGSGVDVCVLEAGEPGWGASGRNGGQVNPGFKALPAAITARHGEERAAGVLEVAGGAPDQVFEVIDRLAIDCHPVRAGYIQGSTSQAGLERGRAWVRQWGALGAPVRELDRDEIAALTGTRAYVGGFLDERGGNLHPLAYARGLARGALSAGARIHGASRVEHLAPADGGWRLATATGSLTARQVILAGNGYTDALVPGLAREVVPVKSVIAATAPLSDNLRRSILCDGHHVSESRHTGVYYRLDPEGRLLMGGRGATFAGPDAAGTGHLERLTVSMFPELDGCRWSHRWGGYVAMTPESMPRLVTPADGLFSGLGFNGRGVAMGTAMGQELARAARGEATRLPLAAPSPIPGHALRNLAVAARVTLGQIRDRLERSWT